MADIQVHPLARLAQSLGNQTVAGLLQTQVPASRASSAPSTAPSAGYDLVHTSVFKLPPVALQTKLLVNAPGDIFEQEADKVSEQVMRKPEGVLPRRLLLPLFNINVLVAVAASV